MSATEKAATADEKTPVAVQKAPSEAENKAREPLMYVGPTIPGIAIQNTVYEPWKLQKGSRFSLIFLFQS